jgi:hypothetical protein
MEVTGMFALLALLCFVLAAAEVDVLGLNLIALGLVFVGRSPAVRLAALGQNPGLVQSGCP